MAILNPSHKENMKVNHGIGAQVMWWESGRIMCGKARLKVTAPKKQPRAVRLLRRPAGSREGQRDHVTPPLSFLFPQWRYMTSKGEALSLAFTCCRRIPSPHSGRQWARVFPFTSDHPVRSRSVTHSVSLKASVHSSRSNPNRSVDFVRAVHLTMKRRREKKKVFASFVVASGLYFARAWRWTRDICAVKAADIALRAFISIYRTLFIRSECPRNSEDEKR